jgi:hypothetical protein
MACSYGGDTHTDCYENLFATDYTRSCCDRFTESLSGYTCCRNVRSRKDRSEFLTSDSKDVIERSQARGHCLRRSAQHVVPDGVSMCVINVLEMIEIKDEQGKRFTKPLVARIHFRKLFIKRAAIEHPGETISSRKIGKRIFGCTNATDHPFKLFCHMMQFRGQLNLDDLYLSRQTVLLRRQADPRFLM